MNSSDAAADAGLAMRRRSDLEVYPQRLRSRRIWVVKDPVTMEYFQLRREEFAIFSWLDGRASLQRIREQFEKQFAPKRVSVARIRSFIASLHRSGLVISDVIGQGDQLSSRAESSRRTRRREALLNPLAVRFPGINPTRFLDWLYPRVRWVYTPACFVACVLWVIAALMLTVGQWSQLSSRLPEWDAFLAPRNLLLLGVAMAGTKVLHELGHALTCRHYGGECHEMGIMLLVLTPCLYCNVSDAWKLPAQKRIAITAAGIVVEIVLAASFAILWCLTQPGVLNTLALNVMLVCSVGTLFLNGNPLLRYDGYYILSDALASPNLWQEASARLRRRSSILFLGIDPGRSVSGEDRSWLLFSFGVASLIYRTVVIASILYLLYQTLQPYGFVIVVQLVAALLLFRMVMGPVQSIWRAITNPAHRQQFRPRRFIAVSSMLIAVVVLLVWLPAPCRINAPAMIRPLDARKIYVKVPGAIVRAIEEGEAVSRGQVLASLSNPDLMLEFERVTGELRRQELRVRSLESFRGEQRVLSSELPAAKEELTDLRDRLQQLQQDVDALSIVSPVAGTVLTPPTVKQASQGHGSLRPWQGTPISKQNRGAHLEKKTLLCLIGEPEAYEAVVYVHQSEVQFVQEGQAVQLDLEIAGTATLEGIVVEVSKANASRIPAQLAVNQKIPSEIGDSGDATPEDTWYRAHVRLHEHGTPLVIGAIGKAEIKVSPQPLAKRLARWFFRSFRRVA